MATDNHNLSKPPRGITGWDEDWYENFDLLDTGVEIRDSQANRHSYTAKAGAKFVATDTENVFIGEAGRGWVQLDTFGPNPRYSDVEADSLNTTDIETDTVAAEDALVIPSYDSLDNAPRERGSLVYATGTAGTAGWYGYAGGTYHQLDGTSDGSGGGDGGISALSELSIDVSKSWRGYDITNVGLLDAVEATIDDISVGSLSVDTAPTESSDAVRLQDLDTKADDPHGNESHSETYLTEDDLTDYGGGGGAPSPHDNDHHSENYATTAHVDSKADDPHGNEAHTPNFSESGHDHSERTIRPRVIEAGATNTGELSIGAEDAVEEWGNNLYTSNGKLHAASGGSTATGKSHVDFHHIDDYGADPSGANYSDAALDDAINALNDGDMLAITNGSYRFRQEHVITNDYITVTGAGSELTIETSEYGGSHAWICFRGDVNNSGSPDTHNSSAIEVGDQEVDVYSTSPFSVGDDVIITEQKRNGSDHFLWGGDNGRSTTQTRSTIRAISGGSLYLTRGSSYFHSTGNAGVYRVDPCKRPHAVDLHMRSGSGETFLMFYFCRHGKMERCYAQNCTGFAYQFFFGNKTVAVDCVSKHPTYTDTRRSSQQEHFRFVGGTDPVLVRPVIEDVRRGIDLNAGTERLKIYEPLITNAQLHAISFHSNTEQSVYGGYEVYGGRIENKQQRVTNDLVHTAYGCGMSPNQTGVKLVGVTIVGRRYGVNSVGTNSDNVLVSGCTVQTVPGFSGYSPIHIGGDNWRVVNNDFRPNPGQEAMRINGSLQDVRVLGNQIDGEIDADGASIDGFWLKNNTINGSYSSPSGSSHYVRDNR